MSETIAKFMLISQERALDQKINSFQETITTLQERYNKETKALQATIASQQDRHEQETKATREVIAHIQDRHKALHGAITSLQDQHDECDEETSSLRETVKSLQSFAKQAEAVQTKLQNENAELRAQLSHTEGSTKKSGMRRIIYYPGSLGLADSGSRTFSYPTSRRREISSCPRTRADHFTAARATGRQEGSCG